MVAAAPFEMNEERTVEHLRDRDRVPGRGGARFTRRAWSACSAMKADDDNRGEEVVFVPQEPAMQRRSAIPHRTRKAGKAIDLRGVFSSSVAKMDSR